jgi:hypothetical protein
MRSHSASLCFQKKSDTQQLVKYIQLRYSRSNKTLINCVFKIPDSNRDRFIKTNKQTNRQERDFALIEENFKLSLHGVSMMDQLL